jgi:hypothetical protein
MAEIEIDIKHKTLSIDLEKDYPSLETIDIDSKNDFIKIEEAEQIGDSPYFVNALSYDTDKVVIIYETPHSERKGKKSVKKYNFFVYEKDGSVYYQDSMDKYSSVAKCIRELLNGEY